VRALILSYAEKSTALLADMLRSTSVPHIVTSSSCAHARRLVLEQHFDVVVINAPLPDETGEDFARHVVAHGTTQVILVVKSEYLDAVSAACENDGIITLAKPIQKRDFWAALTLAKAVHTRMQRMQSENTKLKQRIEDIRIVDRAKCLLISHLSMSEQEAHRSIEKQAMDMRSTRREIAEEILRTYEN